MRMTLVLGGLLLAAGLISSTPTQAAEALGCACVKLGAPVVCSATVIECNVNVGGVCLAACTYETPKKMGKRHKKKKM